MMGNRLLKSIILRGRVSSKMSTARLMKKVTVLARASTSMPLRAALAERYVIVLTKTMRGVSGMMVVT